MKVAGSSFYNSEAADINSRLIAGNTSKLNLEQAKKYSNSASVLIMGLGDGDLVDSMLSHFDRIEVVEGSSDLIDTCSDRFLNIKNLKFHCSFFESFNFKEHDRVKVILGNHVLEHVDNPVDVLIKTQHWITPDGVAIFSVPNADSLHRRIGVEMGLLNDIHELNSQDHLVGHQRVYDKEELERDIRASGYEICEMGGFNLKMLSQKQMVDWSPELISAVYRVSRECPIDFCSNLYVTCKLS